MHRLASLAVIVALLAACSQSPFVPPLDPSGAWSGTWRSTGASVPLTVTFTKATGGWQGVFRSNNADIVALCGIIEDEGPRYLWCATYSSTEVLTWEGDMTDDRWSGVWTYVGPTMNTGGSFTVDRN